jgi:hypothetical protein
VLEFAIPILIFLIIACETPLYCANNSGATAPKVVCFDLKNKGEYWNIIQPFKKALINAPKNNSFKTNEENTEQKLALIEKIAPTLPNCYEILDIAKFRIPNNANQQVALLAAKAEKGTPDSYLTMFTNTRLFIFQKNNDEYIKVWASNQLKGFNLAMLIISDITGEGKPSIVVCEISICGCRTSSHLDIFSNTGSEWHKIFDGGNNEMPGEIRDIDGDGKSEIILRNSIGLRMCHAEQPRWLNIFAYNGRNYSLANHRFPNEFKELRRCILSLISKYPDDNELLYYQEKMRKIFRK